MISIIIVNHNGMEHTRACLQSLILHSHLNNCEIILVDNNSTDGSAELIRKEFPQVTILSQQNNYGFGRANNLGASASTGDYLFFVNNDTLFIEDLATPLSRFLQEHPSCGAIGPLLLNADHTYQHSHGYFPSIFNEWKVQQDARRIKTVPTDLSPKAVDWISFAAVMIPRKVFEHISGFDERYFMYFEDADVCKRLKQKGYTTIYYPRYSLIHIGGSSWSENNAGTIRYEYRRSQLLYYSKHHSVWQTLGLRLFLFVKYATLMIRGEKKSNRAKVFSIIKLATTYHAHRS